MADTMKRLQKELMGLQIAGNIVKIADKVCPVIINQNVVNCNSYTNRTE